LKRNKADGIRSTNQDFIRYDQVEKPQEYRLAEDRDTDLFDDDFQIKSCDLGLLLHGDDRDKARFSHELGEALSEIGFAILENTGIDASGYDAAEDEVFRLFGETSLAEKMKFEAARHGSVNQGYFPLRETSDIHPDLVEGWVFCRRAFDLNPGRSVDVSKFWPDPAFELFFRKHCIRHEVLVLPLIRAMLEYLGGDPHAFDTKMTGTNFGLRLNYYPPVSDEDAASKAGRLLGHEDVDMFTLLPAPRIEGLQALNRRNGKWVRLRAPRGSLILNTGDYMQRISNDLLPSTTHRVSQPRDAGMLGRGRASFPMNVYLWEGEILEVLPGIPNPKYESITALKFHTRITSKFYGDQYAVDDSTGDDS
jgi:isopenicillin N synthase-like dioxygenase